MDETAGDPGWRKAIWRILPLVFLPFLVMGKERAGEPRIVALRAMFLAFVTALFAFLVVLVMLFPLTSSGPADATVYALVGIGPLTLAAIPWSRRRLLSFCGNPTELAGAYTTSLLLGIAFIESAALFGFVATFLAEALWPYLVGMLVALVGFAALAPTSARIRHLDRSLSLRGCEHSLAEGLLDDADGEAAR